METKSTISNIQLRHTGRNESIDLVKLLAMWMILTAHFMGWGGAVNSLTPQDLNYYWVMPVYFVSQAGNTLFFLISGYYLSTFKAEKAIFLERKTAFYAVVISFIVLLLRGVSGISLLKSFFPIAFDYYWFISVYLILYLLWSILGRGCEAASKTQYLIGLAALLFHNLFLVEPKYTLFEGLLAVLTGHYLRRFHPFQNKNKALLAALFVLSVLAYAAERFIVQRLGVEHTKIDEACRYVLIFAPAIFLFSFFEKLRFRKIHFSYFSRNVMAVYLVTAHPLLRNELYQNYLQIEVFCRKGWFLLYYVAVNAVILCACVMLDKVVSRFNQKEAAFWNGLLMKLKEAKQ